MKHGRQRTRSWRNDPHPVGRASASQPHFRLHVLHERLGCRVMIHDRYVVFLFGSQSGRHVNLCHIMFFLERVADYLERVEDSGVEFDASSILPQTRMAACVQSHFLGHHLIVFQDGLNVVVF